MMVTNTNPLSNKGRRMKFILSMMLVVLTPLAQAHGSEAHSKPAVAAIEGRAAPAVKVVEEFSTALQAGDLARAGSLLADEVLILESGGAERSRDEYLGGHAGHDAEFLKTAHVQLIHRTARTEGDLAWVGTESELHAAKDGKPLTLLSTETMVLKSTPDGWRIVHIHWSSRPKP
jgi:ketosteroid isomerase-like protein